MSTSNEVKLVFSPPNNKSDCFVYSDITLNGKKGVYVSYKPKPKPKPKLYRFLKIKIYRYI